MDLWISPRYVAHRYHINRLLLIYRFDVIELAEIPQITLSIDALVFEPCTYRRSVDFCVRWLIKLKVVGILFLHVDWRMCMYMYIYVYGYIYISLCVRNGSGSVNGRRTPQTARLSNYIWVEMSGGSMGAATTVFVNLIDSSFEWLVLKERRKGIDISYFHLLREWIIINY